TLIKFCHFEPANLDPVRKQMSRFPYPVCDRVFHALRFECVTGLMSRRPHMKFQMSRRTNTLWEWQERWLMKRAALSILVTLAALSSCVALTSCKNAAAPVAPAGPPIPTVTVATVVQQDVPIHEESVGTTVGFVNANILPKVSGYLLKQDYRDGSRVRAGQLLFEIDPRQYQAALDQALGELGRAKAQLKQNQLNLARYT